MMKTKYIVSQKNDRSHACHLTILQSEIPNLTITTTCSTDLPGFPPDACIAGRWFTGFSFQFNASNGVPPYTWTSVGVLPDKTTLNSSTGVLSGGPTGWFGPGWTFDVIVTDSRGMTDRKTFYFQSSL
ncbi:MAG TPA: Ig domain-containing protein [Leptospiraceae bacterium]|nr:Ig domain-containing protein [Leptospiraceae bacterium]